ncbi:MAG: hypothetical protein KY454_09180, partial [Actinobacteria bacterium]|nr:hypothetical protein [Actinomycetota bacterium]
LVAFVGVVMGFVLFAPQGDIVVERAQTFTNLEEDTSYNARLDLVDRTAALISPIGIGLGKLSSGSRAASDATLDNGYLVVLGELGLVGLILLGWALVWLSRHSRPPEYGFLALLFITAAGSFVFGNLPGVLLWTLGGAARSPDGMGEPAQVVASTEVGSQSRRNRT